MKFQPYWIGGALVIVVLLASLMFAPARSCAKNCNVLLIMVDTLSGEHLATYGYMRDTMPKTTAFFEKGVIFENASSNAPWTLPSFSSMYFSDLASTITFAELDDNSRPNLQMQLRDSGVALLVIRPKGDNFIFDTITRLFEPGEITSSAQENESSIDVAPKELEQLTAAGQPFFLVVHTFEAHDPYRPREPYTEYFGETDEHPVVTMQQLVAINQSGETLNPELADTFRLRYDQQLAQTDAHLARFLNSIPPETLRTTLIIFSSDHGESFGEHGKLWHASSGLFEEELHVPLMMRVPGVAARRVSEPVSLMDIAPTVLAFMQLPIPETFQGDNLLPVANGKSLGERVIPSVNGFPFFRLPGDISNIQTNLEEAGAAGLPRPIIDLSAAGVRRGDDKVFLIPDGPLSGLYWYDLRADPNEQTNKAEELTVPTDLLDMVSHIHVSSHAP